MIPTGPFIDIHTHILPEIDDGSQSMDETLSMLRQAYSEGIRTIIATPHCGMRNPSFDRAEAAELIAEVQEAADNEVPGMKIIPGNELYYTEGIVEALNRGDVCTLGDSSYALVEFGLDDSFERMSRCIRDMIWNGFKPVIAHLERYISLEGRPGMVARLIEIGAAVQINCRSFMHRESNEGPGIRRIMGRSRAEFALERKSKWAYTLLENGLVHLIASDCHDDYIRRPVMRQTLEAMQEYCSADILADLAVNNPRRLLDNEWIV